MATGCTWLDAGFSSACYACHRLRCLLVGTKRSILQKRKKRTLKGPIGRAVLFLAALVVGLFSAAPAALASSWEEAFPPLGRQYLLVGEAHKKCLTASGTAGVNHWSCDFDAASQQWEFVWKVGPSFENYYQIINRSTNRCMYSPSFGDYAHRVLQTSCDNRSDEQIYKDQLWYVRYDPAYGGAEWALANLNSRRCVVVRASANGTAAVTATCDMRYSDQRWRYRQYP
ncbi:RICIN domain-containing protein [Plantactinospora sp. GCM10030261]|uniref:RICIN domain-containing protein n=1 Tax=Plantactinospora sp. GCM10030261 TaxID=3273420 RepID=UPI00361519C8